MTIKQFHREAGIKMTEYFVCRKDGQFVISKQTDGMSRDVFVTTVDTLQAAADHIESYNNVTNRTFVDAQQLDDFTMFAFMFSKDKDAFLGSVPVYQVIPMCFTVFNDRTGVRFDCVDHLGNVVISGTAKTIDEACKLFTTKWNKHHVAGRYFKVNVTKDNLIDCGCGEYRYDI